MSTPELRPRAADLTDEEQGLYRKYWVYRADGTDKPGDRHHGDDLFVLNLTTDVHARAALRAYAESCRDTHPQLSADLMKKAGVMTDAPPQGLETRGIPFSSHAHHEATDAPTGEPLRMPFKPRPYQVEAIKMLLAQPRSPMNLMPLTGNLAEVKVPPPVRKRSASDQLYEFSHSRNQPKE